MSEKINQDNHSSENKEAFRPENVERDKNYWRSFDELHETPEYKESLNTEFLSSPLRKGFENEGSDNDSFARREFLKLMGASIALTSAAGCIRRPVQKIVPYVKQPEEVLLGTANYYTSTYFDGQEGFGLLVKSREGRPIHIEGNPLFPLNSNGVSVRAQASLLSLYEPDRLQKPSRNLFNEKRTNKESVHTTWETLDESIVKELQNGSVAMLTGNISSPSTNAVIKDFSSAFKVDRYSWEQLAQDDVTDAAKKSFGEGGTSDYRYDKAKMIISIDADFLGAWGAAITANRLFADGRRNPAEMSRMVSFDSTYSLTGANADIRFKIKPSQQLDVVHALIKAVSGQESNISALGINRERFEKVAKDLKANAGKSIVITGGLQTRTEDSENLQLAVNHLNSILGNFGKTIFTKSGNKNLTASYDSMKQLIKNMNAGSVKTLIIYRTNPVYGLAEKAGFLEAIKKVKTVIFIGDKLDETAQHAHYIVADSHDLEKWGDAEFANGLYAIHQPLIRSMYDTRSFELSLMTWAYLAKVGPKRLQEYEIFYDYFRAFMKEEILPKYGKGKDFDTFWNELLQKGYVGDVNSASASAAAGYSPATKKTKESELELVLYPTSHIGDGQLANIAWLQELPNPVSKIVWDNYASVSLKTAEAKGLKQGDMVQVKVGEDTVDIPLHIQPGLHDGVVAISVGYGRTHAGKVGNKIGVNVNSLAQLNKNGDLLFAGLPTEIKKLGRKYNLVTTQGHDSMEGRQIVVQATNKDYEKSKDANIHRHHTWSIWSGHQYNGHKWGMGVDLNTCTGCSACMTACQSENNIHVVGKEYVMQGREMHWIRIDRYYVGDVENAQAVFQPVMCQHCDNAPCEVVCPATATVHTDEGLNDMVYNRCIGTRYCSNNCPYKVRRFNWFNYAKLIEKPMHMALNPEVTVRARGVMEKCSFCVQRIKDAKSKANIENRNLKDGDVKTACQSACPTSAIVFGDLNDEKSEVHQIFKKEERSYALLEEWYAQPSVRYMSKIRNNDEVTETKHSAATSEPHNSVVTPTKGDAHA